MHDLSGILKVMLRGAGGGEQGVFTAGVRVIPAGALQIPQKILTVFLKILTKFSPKTDHKHSIMSRKF